MNIELAVGRSASWAEAKGEGGGGGRGGEGERLAAWAQLREILQLSFVNTLGVGGWRMVRGKGGRGGGGGWCGEKAMWLRPVQSWIISYGNVWLPSGTYVSMYIYIQTYKLTNQHAYRDNTPCYLNQNGLYKQRDVWRGVGIVNTTFQLLPPVEKKPQERKSNHSPVGQWNMAAVLRGLTADNLDAWQASSLISHWTWGQVNLSAWECAWWWVCNVSVCL